ncbi:FeoB-associated Cys-rich membrane protein [Fulvivirga sedimenti]|uniref:FeoB-associated Cys-rich membrane protein n=1 Tax=Fulvivirga sedimenti TaxID=2879465 RepID=A0A9X1HWQ7_9BACT|nr:FeoB-associated Cys-rich membrane protein [Fulvivirga sedimenti]MCA6078192.1 FeoB-associated Cys-rich membrane protein [Fulvivirga sedimenti]
MQEILLVILFIGAIIYVARHIYLQNKPGQEGCGPKCGCDSPARQSLLSRAKPK